MKAIHGRTVKNDKIDSQKIVQLLRSGMLAIAYAYPKEWRAARDLLRRRLYLSRRHSEVSAHIQNTLHQYNLPRFEKRLDRVSNRVGLADYFKDPSGSASIEVDSFVMEAMHTKMLDIERTISESVHHHDPVAVHLLSSIPGIGKVLTLVILYEIGDIDRFPKVGTFRSYACLVKCAHESAGKRMAGKNTKIGNVHLKWPSARQLVFSCGTMSGERAGNRNWLVNRGRLNRFPSSPKDLSVLYIRFSKRGPHLTRSGSMNR